MSSPAGTGMTSPDEAGGSWTLLTGHGHVLVEIARNPQARMRHQRRGLTERTVQAIVTDLEAAGYLTRDRDGHRNVYTVNPDILFRHRPRKAFGSDRSSTCLLRPVTPWLLVPSRRQCFDSIDHAALRAGCGPGSGISACWRW